MHIQVNGVGLHFDVLGAKLEPRGPLMQERPTVLMLHGGPGADHSHYRPEWDALADIAQLIYLDHRGNGRSEAGPQSAWTLAQWADDARAFCEVLGTERRVALFEQPGGSEAGALARRRLIDGDTSPEVLLAWLRFAVPLYTRTKPDPDAMQRQVRNVESTRWFSRADGKGSHFDLRADLQQREIAALLPPHRLRYEEFAHAGRGVLPDAREATLALLREFILA